MKNITILKLTLSFLLSTILAILSPIQLFAQSGTEIPCNNIDDNGDGIIDENSVFVTYYADFDGDGFGNPNNPATSCNGAPASYILNNTDCDDGNLNIFPGSVEIACNGLDDDCDGTIDENNVFVTYYADFDGDGFGNANNPSTSCNGAPASYILNNTDCDDGNVAIFPGSVEIACNGLDDDCDGTIDENNVFVTYYADFDGDGFGNPNNPATSCNGAPNNYILNNTDCDDGNAAIFPGSIEIACNGLDDDCDGTIDENNVFVSYYADFDGDGFGNPNNPATSCNGAPNNYILNNTDCDDGNSSINPNATEIVGNNIDDNCNGCVDEASPLILTVNATNPTLFGGNGSIVFSATGGSANNVYSINGSAATSPYTAIAGSYTISVAEMSGCSVSTIVTIVNPINFAISAITTSPLCFGGNGTIALSTSSTNTPITYSINGATVTSPSTQPAGTYTIIATDNTSAMASTIVTITQPSPMVLSGLTLSGMNCFGSSTLFNYQVTGGTGGIFGTGINYTLNGTPTVFPIITTAGVYTIIATDNNGCVFSSIETITEPTPLMLTASSTNPLCNGGNGTLNFSLSGGTVTFGYGYLLNSITPINAPYSAPVGTYTIYAADNNNCTATTVLTITEPTAVALTASSTNALCNGGNGSLTFNATGGTGTKTFSINGTTSTSPATRSAGTYTIIATDVNSCTASTVLTITTPTTVALTASSTNALCNGGNGSLTFNATGGTGTGTKTFNINGTAASSPASSAAGTYTIITSDANSCTASTTLTITSPTAVALTASSTNALCNGGNGSLTFSATGGTGIKTFSINGTAATSPATRAAGTYTIIAADANSCTTSTVLTITAPTAIVLTASSISLLCNGGNGTLTFSATGGTGTFTYKVNGNERTSPLNTPAGAYTIQAIDANFCSVTSAVVITAPSNLILTTAITQAICHNGLATLNFSSTGGVAPYSFKVNGNVQTSPFSAPSATIYTIQVTDANGCSKSTIVSAFGITQINNTPIWSQPACWNGNINVTLNPSDGVAPYSSIVNGLPLIGTTISIPFANALTVVTTDAIGCVSTFNSALLNANQSGPPAFNINITAPINCNGGSTIVNPNIVNVSNVSVVLNGQSIGTNWPYNFTAGTYSCTAIDAINGCSISTIFTLTEPSAIALNASSTNPSCNGGNGSITFSATGGTGSITYKVNGVTQSSPYNAAAGSYTIIATDANACSASTSQTITQPSAIALTSSVTNALCNGGNGSLTFNATGAMSYTVNGTTSTSPSSKPAGTYTIIATNANGCTTTAIQTITAPSAVTLTVNASHPSCNGGNGSLTFSATGGTGAIAYTINGSAATSPASLAAGSHTIIATDVNGCTTSLIETITEPAILILSTNNPTISCNGNNGSLNFSALGGTVPYNYTVNGFAAIPPNIFAPAGSYTVIVTDNNGCTNSNVVTITEPPLLTISATITNPTTIGGTGSITFAASGGVPNYVYLVNGTIATSPYTNIAGTYLVCAQDNNGNGCGNCTTVTLSDPINFELSTNAKSPFCFGDNGSISFYATSMNMPISYTLNGIPATSPQSQPVGVYTVIATDNIGATISSIVTINPIPSFTSTTSQTNITCNGLANGIFAVAVSGGMAPYTYSPNVPLTQIASGSFASVPAGSYTIVTTDANNCTITNLVTITQPASIGFNPTVVALPICNGSATGSLNLTAFGGTSPLAYTLTPNNGMQTTPGSFINLPSTVYVVRVTDANNCKRSKVVVLPQPAALNFTAITKTNINCNGDSTGVITANVVGGSGMKAISTMLSGIVLAANSIGQLTAGNYVVTAMDANSCTKTTMVTLTQATPIIFSTPVTSYPASSATGKIIVSATGGIGSKAYSINSALATQMPTGTFNGLVTGNYILTATDAKSCTKTTSMVLTQSAIAVTEANQPAAVIIENEIVLYPNPTSTSSTLSFEAASNSHATISITTTNGKEVKRIEAAILAGENKINIDLSELPTGAYIVQFVAAGRRWTTTTSKL
jgi:large repetitive protein